MIHRQSWKNREAVELATLAWVEWFNHRRRLEPIGNMPPAEAEAEAEAEAAYYRQLAEPRQGGVTHTKEPPEFPGRFIPGSA